MAVLLIAASCLVVQPPPRLVVHHAPRSVVGTPYLKVAARNRHDDVRCAAATTAVPAFVSLAAGMVGGAIGVGVAYPLDTLKTKQQASAGSENLGPVELTRQIYRAEGVAGFYGGVTTTMAGQAIIKGALFFVYGAARNALARTTLGLTTATLCLAAAISGAVGSFVMVRRRPLSRPPGTSHCALRVDLHHARLPWHAPTLLISPPSPDRRPRGVRATQAPVERVKCVMQAKAAGTFPNPIACIRELLARDGVSGLCFRGLGATVLREIPACTFYLVGFDLAKAALVGRLPRTPALLLSGAFAGALSWVPVYPIDVVKTQIQIELDGGSGDADNSFVGHVRRLWRAGGPMAFWDGIGPKLARAIVNHAVTFLVFDNLCAAWLGLSR